jgi:hypothetical protein
MSLLLLGALHSFWAGPASAQQSCDISAFETAPFTLYFTEAANFSITTSTGFTQYSERAQGQAAMSLSGFAPAFDDFFGDGTINGTGSISLTSNDPQVTASRFGSVLPISVTAGGAIVNPGGLAGASFFFIEINKTDLLSGPACTFNAQIEYWIPVTGSVNVTNFIGPVIQGGTGYNQNFAFYQTSCIGNGNTNFPLALGSGQMSGSLSCPISGATTFNAGQQIILPADPGGAVTLSWSTSTATTSNDKVTLNNTSGNENGILVNGISNGTQLEHKTFGPTTSNPVDLGANITSSSQANGNEVVAFTGSRPPALLSPAQWTNGVDDLQMTFDDEITLGIQFWIVGGPYGKSVQKALNQLIMANNIYISERSGLKFVVPNVGFVDATSNPYASLFSNQVFCYGNALLLPSLIGKTPGLINVYVLSGTINFSSAAEGSTCSVGNTDIILLQQLSSADTLAHELGHTLGLLHVSSDQYFDFTNLMYGGDSPVRKVAYLTEGQNFRASFRSDSAVNWLYHKRSGPQRACLTFLSGLLASSEPEGVRLDCPAVWKRIWPDGSFGPN